MSKAKWIGLGVAAFVIYSIAKSENEQRGGAGSPDFLACERLATLGHRACSWGMARVGGNALGEGAICGIEPARLDAARGRLRSVVERVPGEPQIRDLVVREAEIAESALIFAARSGGQRVDCTRAPDRFQGMVRSLDAMGY